MKVLITGAGGFIGAYLIKEFQKTHEVACLLMPGEKLRPFDGGPIPEVKTFVGNVTDPKSLIEASQWPEAVVHAAGLIRAIKSSDYERVNTQGTQNLIEALKAHNPQLKYFLLFSSSAAGGASPSLHKPLTEGEDFAPLGDYGRSKRKAEVVLKLASFKTTALRITSVYGGGSSEYISYFKAAKFHLAPRFGLGQQFFSLIHASDLATACRLLVDHHQESQDLYYLSDGHIYSWPEVTEVTKKFLPGLRIPFPVPGPLLYLIGAIVALLAFIGRKPAFLTPEKVSLLLKPYLTNNPTRFQKQFPQMKFSEFKQAIEENYQWYVRNKWL